MAFVAIYDANVLYPGSLRDLLIRLGQTGLFQAKRTDQIPDEMVDAIVAAQPDLADRLQWTRELMNEAIPDVRITGYEHLIDSLQLPDPDDRHVLAAAIRADALEPYDIEAQIADEFVLHVLELAPARVVSTIEDQARALKNPPTTPDDLLDRLRAVGLPRAVAAIRHQLDG